MNSLDVPRGPSSRPDLTGVLCSGCLAALERAVIDTATPGGVRWRFCADRLQVVFGFVFGRELVDAPSLPAVSKEHAEGSLLWQFLDFYVRQLGFAKITRRGEVRCADGGRCVGDAVASPSFRAGTDVAPASRTLGVVSQSSASPLPQCRTNSERGAARSGPERPRDRAVQVHPAAHHISEEKRMDNDRSSPRRAFAMPPRRIGEELLIAEEVSREPR
jgi:hypothetical protein